MESQFLVLFCLFLCLYWTNAINSFDEPLPWYDDNVPDKTKHILQEKVKAIPVAALKELVQVHEHELQASYSGNEYTMRHINITGFPDCDIVDVSLGVNKSDIDFDIYCSRIIARSRNCPRNDNKDVGKCHLCYYNYVFKFKTEVGFDFTDKMIQFLKDGQSSFTYEKNNNVDTKSDGLNICPKEYDDELPEENIKLLKELFFDAIFTASSRKILESVNKHVGKLDIHAMYLEGKQ